ncbi:MAG: hypothetical protein WC100_01615 [Sterolibacterium sp.]
MATGNQINLCNRALLQIGARGQISSLNEGSTESDACNTLYTPTFESLARAAYWNCLRMQKTLTLLAAAAGTPENQNGATLPLPPQPWLYAYALPSDSLAARYLVPTFPNPLNNGVPLNSGFIAASACLPQQQIPFQVAYATDVNNQPLQIILTNQTQAQLVYTVNQPNPQLWDSELQSAFVASLGAFLVPALSLHLGLMKMQAQIAEGLIASARVRDANEGSTQQDHIPDWIRARNSGGYAYGTGCSAYGAYSDMSWPGVW